MSTLIYTIHTQDAAAKAAIRKAESVYTVARMRVGDSFEAIHVRTPKAEAARILRLFGTSQSIRWYQYGDMLIIDQENVGDDPEGEDNV